MAKVERKAEFCRQDFASQANPVSMCAIAYWAELKMVPVAEPVPVEGCGAVEVEACPVEILEDVAVETGWGLTRKRLVGAEAVLEAVLGKRGVFVVEFLSAVVEGVLVVAGKC